MAFIPQTIFINNKRFHIINEIRVQCSGVGCKFCNSSEDISFEEWEKSIPFPIPKKGKRYKNPKINKQRGKTILEICYSCKNTPCYICKRAKCSSWMKEKQRQGQEKGCASWQNGRCLEFYCKYGLIKTRW